MSYDNDNDDYNSKKVKRGLFTFGRWTPPDKQGWTLNKHPDDNDDDENGICIGFGTYGSTSGGPQDDCHCG